MPRPARSPARTPPWGVRPRGPASGRGARPVREISARRRALLVLGGLYAVGLAVILLWPDHLDRDAGFAYGVIYAVFPGADPLQVDFALNVLLFVPFGVLLAVFLRRWPWVVLVVSLGVPTIIETAQALLLPGRTASAGDVVANAVGALAGVTVTALACRRVTRTHTRSRV